MCRSKVKCNPCRIADLLPKRRNVQNLTPLYGFGAILGAFFRYEQLCFSGGILYRPPFKSCRLSLPGNKKAPYCYGAFVLLGRWSKGTLFHYLLYFFFLLTTVVPIAAPPLANNRAIHKAKLLVSPVWGLLSDVPGLVLAGFFSRAAIASSIAFAILSTSDCSVIFLPRTTALTAASTPEKSL